MKTLYFLLLSNFFFLHCTSNPRLLLDSQKVQLDIQMHKNIYIRSPRIFIDKIEIQKVWEEVLFQEDIRGRMEASNFQLFATKEKEKLFSPIYSIKFKSDILFIPKLENCKEIIPVKKKLVIVGNYFDEISLLEEYKKIVRTEILKAKKDLELQCKLK